MSAVLAGCNASTAPTTEPVSTDAQITGYRRQIATATDTDSVLDAIDELARRGPGAMEAADDLLKVARAGSGLARARAARALGYVAVGREDIMREVGGLVGDSSPEVAMQAAAAVGRIARNGEVGINAPGVPDSVIRALVAACSHPNAQVRKTSLQTLMTLTPATEEIGPIIAETLRSADFASLLPVLGTLADSGSAAVPWLRKALADPSAAYWASVVARDIGPAASGAVPSLGRIAADSAADAAVRVQAVLAIAAIGAPTGDTISQLNDCLAANKPSLRTAAAFALGKLRARDAESALRSASLEADQAVASMAAWALARIHPDDPVLAAEAMRRLKDRLANGETGTRIAVLSVLAELGECGTDDDRRGLADAAARFLGDDDPAVRSAARMAILPLGTMAADALATAVRKPASRRAALEAIATLPECTGSLIDALLPLLSSTEPDDVVIGACIALAETGGSTSETIAAMKRLVADESASIDVRRSAAYALGRCGIAAESATAELVALAASSDPLLNVVARWAVASVRPTDEDSTREAVKYLGSALEADDESVRSAACLALGELATRARTALARLDQLGADDPSRVVQQSARDAASRIRAAVAP